MDAVAHRVNYSDPKHDCDKKDQKKVSWDSQPAKATVAASGRPITTAHVVATEEVTRGKMRETCNPAERAFRAGRIPMRMATVAMIILEQLGGSGRPHSPYGTQMFFT